MSSGLCAFPLNDVRKGTALQLDDEGRSTAFMTIDSDSAAVLENNLTTKTEANACAGRFGGKERNKSMFEDVGRHAAAVVFYADFTIAGTDLHLGSPAFVGILDKIDKHLLQLGTVSSQLGFDGFSIEQSDHFREQDLYVREEVADGEGGTLWCLDARQLTITFHKVEERVATTIDDSKSFVLVG